LLHPPPKGGGKVVLGDGLDDSLAALLEALLDHWEASQLKLQMANCLDPLCRQVILNKGGDMAWDVVLVQEQLYDDICKSGSLLSENLQEREKEKEKEKKKRERKRKQKKKREVEH
jgi:hypothetical protein